jgi:transmembrane sensor
MQKLDAKGYFKKYQAGECSPQEQVIIERYIMSGGVSPDQIKNMMFELNELHSRINEIPGKNKKVNWPLQILLVAATVAVIGSVWTILFTKNASTSITYSNDVNPGGNRAVLTLQNGKKIQLSEAKEGIIIDASKLTYNDGTLINNGYSETFTISTPRGGTYQVYLPDGSKVWLNAASSLTYSMTSLRERDGRRQVRLTGEAYFEVAKDKKHPFTVTTDKQKIEVLGTHFNVSAYRDELAVKTTLLEGSVNVAPLTNSSNAAKGIILKPNQESDLNSSGIKVTNVDASQAIAWKNGEFSFANEKLEVIMQKIARWYDVEVIYADRKTANKPFSGTISKYKNVSEVLKLLEVTGEVHFEIEGRRIKTMP